MKRKVPYKLGRVLSLATIMAIANACHKDPQPTPTPEPTPTDTVTPIIPTKEIVLDWNWDANIGWAPPQDSIKYYTDQDSVKSVTINIIGRNGVDVPVNCSGYRTSTFRRARAALQPCIDIDSTEVRLSGTFEVSNNIILYNNDTLGIAPNEKEWFERHGCIIIPAHSR